MSIERFSLFRDMEFASALFSQCSLPWEALDRLPSFLRRNINAMGSIQGTVHEKAILIGNQIEIGQGSFIDAGAVLRSPVSIGRNCYIGHCALVRENTLIGEDSVIGHATEIKDSIVFPRSRASHFNFIGDSIIGSGVNLGGGTVISNFEFGADDDLRTVQITCYGQRVDTGRHKLGAILGDGVKTGSNSALSPGSIIGINSIVFPSICVRKGIAPALSKIDSEYYLRKR